VLGNVEDGVAGTRALLGHYNEVAAKLAADYSDNLLDEMGHLQEQVDRSGAWDLDSRVEQAMDALRCSPPDADVATSLPAGVADVNGSSRRIMVKLTGMPVGTTAVTRGPVPDPG
jgi:ATPase subunit of ABC transporter with duplicated ATPase domains